MKRAVEVEWTCSQQIEVDIPDGEMTSEEIEAAIGKAAKRILPGDGDCCDNWEWNWLGREPVAKGEGNTPPDDYWFEAAGYTVATNGYALITKDCPVEFTNDAVWQKLDEATPGIIDLLSVDFASFPLHRGWFRNAFKCFSGYRVVGRSKSGNNRSEHSYAYVLDESGKFVALLSEAMSDGSKYFQFNPDEVK